MGDRYPVTQALGSVASDYMTPMVFARFSNPCSSAAATSSGYVRVGNTGLIDGLVQLNQNPYSKGADKNAEYLLGLINGLQTPSDPSHDDKLFRRLELYDVTAVLFSSPFRVSWDSGANALSFGLGNEFQSQFQPDPDAAPTPQSSDCVWSRHCDLPTRGWLDDDASHSQVSDNTVSFALQKKLSQQLMPRLDRIQKIQDRMNSIAAAFASKIHQYHISKAKSKSPAPTTTPSAHRCEMCFESSFLRLTVVLEVRVLFASLTSENIENVQHTLLGMSGIGKTSSFTSTPYSFSPATDMTAWVTVQEFDPFCLLQQVDAPPDKGPTVALTNSGNVVVGPLQKSSASPLPPRMTRLSPYWIWTTCGEDPQVIESAQSAQQPQLGDPVAYASPYSFHRQYNSNECPYTSGSFSTEDLTSMQDAAKSIDNGKKLSNINGTGDVNGLDGTVTGVNMSIDVFPTDSSSGKGDLGNALSSYTQTTLATPSGVNSDRYTLNQYAKYQVAKGLPYATPTSDNWTPSDPDAAVMQQSESEDGETTFKYRTDAEYTQPASMRKYKYKHLTYRAQTTNLETRMAPYMGSYCTQNSDCYRYADMEDTKSNVFCPADQNLFTQYAGIGKASFNACHNWMCTPLRESGDCMQLNNDGIDVARDNAVNLPKVDCETGGQVYDTKGTCNCSKTSIDDSLLAALTDNSKYDCETSMGYDYRCKWTPSNEDDGLTGGTYKQSFANHDDDSSTDQDHILGKYQRGSCTVPFLQPPYVVYDAADGGAVPYDALGGPVCKNEAVFDADKQEGLCDSLWGGKVVGQASDGQPVCQFGSRYFPAKSSTSWLNNPCSIAEMYGIDRSSTTLLDMNTWPTFLKSFQPKGLYSKYLNCNFGKNKDFFGDDLAATLRRMSLLTRVLSYGTTMGKAVSGTHNDARISSGSIGSVPGFCSDSAARDLSFNWDSSSVWGTTSADLKQPLFVQLDTGGEILSNTDKKITDKTLVEHLNGEVGASSRQMALGDLPLYTSKSSGSVYYACMSDNLKYMALVRRADPAPSSGAVSLSELHVVQNTFRNQEYLYATDVSDAIEGTKWSSSDGTNMSNFFKNYCADFTATFVNDDGSLNDFGAPRMLNSGSNLENAASDVLKCIEDNYKAATGSASISYSSDRQTPREKGMDLLRRPASDWGWKRSLSDPDRVWSALVYPTLSLDVLSSLDRFSEFVLIVDSPTSVTPQPFTVRGRYLDPVCNFVSDPNSKEKISGDNPTEWSVLQPRTLVAFQTVFGRLYQPFNTPKDMQDNLLATNDVWDNTVTSIVFPVNQDTPTGSQNIVQLFKNSVDCNVCTGVVNGNWSDSFVRVNNKVTRIPNSESTNFCGCYTNNDSNQGNIDQLVTKDLLNNNQTSIQICAESVVNTGEIDAQEFNLNVSCKQNTTDDSGNKTTNNTSTDILVSVQDWYNAAPTGERVGVIVGSSLGGVLVIVGLVFLIRYIIQRIKKGKQGN